MIENIRLTPTQALELAQDAQVLRWDVDTKPWVRFSHEELKSQQDKLISESMSKRFFNLVVNTGYDYSGSNSYSDIRITMIVTWNHEVRLFIRREMTNTIETFKDIESAYSFIINYLRKYGDPNYTRKIINY